MVLSCLAAVKPTLKRPNSSIQEAPFRWIPARTRLPIGSRINFLTQILSLVLDLEGAYTGDILFGKLGRENVRHGVSELATRIDSPELTRHEPVSATGQTTEDPGWCRFRLYLVLTARGFAWSLWLLFCEVLRGLLTC